MGNPGGHGNALTDAIYRVLIRHVAQPIVDLHTMETVGHEYFTRFTLQPFQSPEVLFTRAAQIQLLDRVDVRTLRGCLERAEREQGAVHVNIHISTLLSVDIEGLWAMCGRLTDRPICLELNERELVDSPRDVISATARAQAVGFQLAIDDFGVGSTSFDYASWIGPDVIKIDRSLVRDLERDPVRQRVVRRIVGAAKGIHAEPIAEGLETEAAKDVLIDLGVFCAQGYLFSRPV